MASVNEIIGELSDSEEGRAAISGALGSPEALRALLAAHGCEVGLEQAAAYLGGRSDREGELADEELESVAGGCGGSSDITCPAGCGGTSAYPVVCNDGNRYYCPDCGHHFSRTDIGWPAVRFNDEWYWW